MGTTTGAARHAGIDVSKERLDVCLLQESEVWRRNEQMLRSVPGVGPVVARTLLLELPELGPITHKCHSSLGGVAHFNRDSGKM